MFLDTDKVDERELLGGYNEVGLTECHTLYSPLRLHQHICKPLQPAVFAMEGCCCCCSGKLEIEMINWDKKVQARQLQLN